MEEVRQRVQAANVAVRTSTVSANIIPYLIFMCRVKRPFVSDVCQTYTRQQTRACLTSEGGGRQQGFTQIAPKELKLGEGGYSDKSWPSARRRRRGVFVRHLGFLFYFIFHFFILS